MRFFLLFLFLLNLKARGNEVNEIADLMKRRRTKYNQALDLIKQSYQILYELEKDFFVDSSDFFKALEYFQLKKYNKCSPIFIALIKKDEYKLESMFLLAECYFEQKKIKDAALIYNAIVIAQYNFMDEKTVKILKYSFLKLIDCFILLGQKRDACAAMKNYVKIFPEEKNNPEVQLFCKQNKCGSILDEVEITENENEYLEDSSESSVSVVVKTNNLSKKKKKRIKVKK